MSMDSKYADMKDATICHNLSAEQFATLESLVEEVFVEGNTVIMNEGDPARELYFIKYGEVAVLKRDESSGEYHQITTIGPGATIGEVALLDHKPRSASIRTTRDSILLKLDFTDLNESSTAKTSLESQVKLNLAEDLAADLRHTNEAVVKSLREKLESVRSRVAMGVIINTLLIGIVTYVFALQAIEALNQRVPDTTFVSVPILFFFGGLAYFASKRSGYPLSTYGLTLKNGRRSIVESILPTLFFVVLIILVKWLLVRFHPSMEGEAIFSMIGDPERFFSWTNAVVIIAYTLFVPIQEFIARGCMQTAFEEFLLGKHRKTLAILVANLTFAMTHVHLSPLFGLLVFVPGLVWGWLYSRHRSLIGISVSHIVVGIVAFSIVGFEAMYL